ncbi:MAG: NYN domain-containing protein [Candidatus Omnitrophica bacterium]|nr:NYN domain-containing protein [Candidatus Omnitrophota bacterium]
MSLKKKALILIDDANVYYGFKKAKWELDFEKFKKWLNSEFDIVDIYFFGGIISKKTFFDRHPMYTLSGFIKYKKSRESFFKMLKAVGYKVRTKPVSSLYDNMAGSFKRKCNFDVEMTITALDRIGDYEELVLCSGDGDFEKLLRYVKGKFKKATLIAHKDRLNQNLFATANRIIFFDKIKEKVIKKKELP